MKRSLSFCLVALLGAGSLHGKEINWDKNPEAGLKTLLKKRTKVSPIKGAPVKRVRKNNLQNTCDGLPALLPKLEKFSLELAQAELRESSARVAPKLGSNVFNKDELLQYYKSAVRQIFQSNNGLDSLSQLFTEELNNPVYNARERQTLEDFRINLQYGRARRMEAGIDLVSTFRNSANNIVETGGEHISFKDVSFYEKLGEDASLLLQKNAEISAGIVKTVRNLCGSSENDAPPVIVIGKYTEETPQSAQNAFVQALNEPRTAFLIFRSSSKNEEAVKALVAKARSVTQWNSAEWRVLWIKEEALLPSSLIKSYFGSDDKIAAVSLRWGGNAAGHRTVVETFELKDLNENELFGAFTQAGPQ